MEFTYRLRQVLLILLKEENILSVKNLANMIGVSKRTVQRELEYMNYSLKKYNITLCSKTGSGIWLEGKQEDKEKLFEILENQDIINSADKEKRRKNLILELLKDQEPKKLYYFANLFDVSEATISKDIEKVEIWFDKYGLKIIKKQGFGVMLQGSEKNYRIAVREFIAQNIDTPIIEHIYDKEKLNAHENIKSQDIKNIYNLLDDNILKRVCTCFSSIRDKRIMQLTEESYISLVLHITIAVDRILKGDIIENNEKLIKDLNNDRDYNLAILIVNSLENEFEMEIPDIELMYIYLHIKGSKVQKSDDINKILENNEEITDLAHEMIIAYDESIASILENDEEFINGLVLHLRPTLVRIRNNMPIENPHLNEIKQTYSEIFENCKQVAKFMKARLGCEIPESEVGFLVIHFGAALVRLENEREKKRVVDIGLICASGIGISRLMSSRLKKFMKSRVNISTYGKEDLTPFIISKNDFFISSMLIDGLEADIINVSPLLPENDINRIEEKVIYYEKQPKFREDNTDFAKQLEKINYLSVHIKYILKEFKCIEVEETLGFREVLHMIALNITDNNILQQYIEKDIKKREEIATQVIPELKIALFHAKTLGVIKPCIYVCTTKNHEEFKHVYFQKIKAIIIMLIPENGYKEENGILVGYISEQLVENQEFLEQIKEGNQEIIRDKLTKILKQYFNNYLDKV